MQNIRKNGKQTIYQSNCINIQKLNKCDASATDTIQSGINV